MNQPELAIVNTETSKKSHKGTGQRMDIIMGESYQLTKLIEAEYKASGMNDTQFAEYSMTKVKLRPGVTIKDQTVKLRRESLGIPNNKALAKAADPSALAATVLAQDMRISALEERLDMLETWINATFPNKGPRKTL